MERLLCIDCGILPRRPKGRYLSKKTGQVRRYYSQRCEACHERKYKIVKNPYRGYKVYKAYKSSVCCLCGFLPVHTCQLDVDHKDGNPNNNDPANLQTLCANCHRLKTLVNRDGIYRD